MKISRGVVLATLMTVVAAPVFAYNFNDVNSAVSVLGGSDAMSQSGLLSSLSSQLNVTPEQAIGGTGAMLGLAKNKLTSGDYSQLTQSVPGIDKLSGSRALNGLGGLLGKSGDSSMLSNALGNVKTADDLNNSFSALGMDSGMVGKFAPIILEYLGKQGVGGSVLQSLGGIWGAGS